MEHTNHYYGQLGERIARDYLVSRGYQIVLSNARVGNDEIDIIAHPPQSNEILCFIEVKTRRTKGFGSAEYQFSAKKSRFLKRSALRFCQQHNLSEDLIRLEAIAVNLNMSKKLANIKHFKNLL